MNCNLSAEFDVVIIGAGHNSLTLGAYLAKAGVRVALLERREVAGGGLCTESPILPGFTHNLHSNYHLWRDYAPAWNDLELERFGMKYVEPEAPWAAPLSNGKCIYIHRDAEKTSESFAKFSKRDADTFLKLKREIDPVFRDLMLSFYYTVPKEPNEEYERILGGLSFYDFEWAKKTPFEVADELFEDEIVKTFILANIWFAGWAPNYEGFGDFVPLFAGICNHLYMPKRGSHYLADVLERVIGYYGGTILREAPISSIIVRNGEAIGVELPEEAKVPAKRIYARKAVVSGVDVTQTLLDLVGPGHLKSELIEKVKNFDYTGNALFCVHLALTEPPKYSSSQFDPIIDKAWSMDIGYENYDDLKEHVEEIESGVMPRNPRFEASSNSVLDPDLAPPGRHTAVVYQEMPTTFKLKMSRDEFNERREGYADLCLETWRRYAPNLTKEKVLGRYVYTPFEYSEKLVSMRGGNWALGSMDAGQWWTNRPLPELSQYRTPIKNLYLCSSSCHPGGSIFLAAGYNAANIIAEDLGIQKWWPPETSGGPTQVV